MNIKQRSISFINAIKKLADVIVATLAGAFIVKDNKGKGMGVFSRDGYFLPLIADKKSKIAHIKRPNRWDMKK
jgi:hypothetical protein